MVENPLLELFKLIPASDEGLPTLLIAFDEAAKLYTDGMNSRTGSGKELPHTSIRRMFRSLRRHPMWSVFISTNLRTEMFAPSQIYDSSARIVSRSLKM